MYKYIHIYIYTHHLYGTQNHYNPPVLTCEIYRNPLCFPISPLWPQPQELRALHLLLQPVLQLAEVREARQKASEALERFGAWAKKCRKTWETSI